jgi:hypothetical protein
VVKEIEAGLAQLELGKKLKKQLIFFPTPVILNDDLLRVLLMQHAQPNGIPILLTSLLKMEA